MTCEVKKKLEEACIVPKRDIDNLIVDSLNQWLLTWF